MPSTKNCLNFKIETDNSAEAEKASKLELQYEDYTLLKNTKLRIAGYQHESIVDGKGIRTTVFFQGCDFHCIACHNPHTHDKNAGTLVTALEVYEEIFSSKLAKGVTFSGGEPFLQEEALRNLAKVCTNVGRDVTIYTGHELDEILSSHYCQNEEKLQLRKEILDNYVNTLITGRFVQALKTYEKAFVGSSNQQIHTLK